MRDIKFRAWDEQQEEFYYFGVVNDNKNLVEDGCFGQGYIEINAEQYTGLKDKNGKEIYEGDISKYGYVIKYNEKKALFAEHDIDRGSLMSYPMDSGNIEIIGNIHE